MEDDPILYQKLNPPPLEWDEELDDEELFRLAMREVRPLRDRPSALPGRSREGAAQGKEQTLSRHLLEAFVAGELEFPWSHNPDYVEGGPEDWNHLLLKRLREGTYAVQAELDLHGMTQREAKEALYRFLTRCRRRGFTCVRIVHGRGRNSPQHVPVLKQRIQKWFEARRFARLVVAFTSARPVDGGAGAIYVLLR